MISDIIIARKRDLPVVHPYFRIAGATALEAALKTTVTKDFGTLLLGAQHPTVRYPCQNLKKFEVKSGGIKKGNKKQKIAVETTTDIPLINLSKSLKRKLKKQAETGTLDEEACAGKAKKVEDKETPPLNTEALANFDKFILTAQVYQDEFVVRDGKKVLTGEKTEKIVHYAIRKFKEAHGVFAKPAKKNLAKPDSGELVESSDSDDEPDGLPAPVGLDKELDTKFKNLLIDAAAVGYKPLGLSEVTTWAVNMMQEWERDPSGAGASGMLFRCQAVAGFAYKLMPVGFNDAPPSRTQHLKPVNFRGDLVVELICFVCGEKHKAAVHAAATEIANTVKQEVVREDAKHNAFSEDVLPLGTKIYKTIANSILRGGKPEAPPTGAEAGASTGVNADLEWLQEQGVVKVLREKEKEEEKTERPPVGFQKKKEEFEQKHRSEHEKFMKQHAIKEAALKELEKAFKERVTDKEEKNALSETEKHAEQKKLDDQKETCKEEKKAHERSQDEKKRAMMCMGRQVISQLSMVNTGATYTMAHWAGVENEIPLKAGKYGVVQASRVITPEEYLAIPYTGVAHQRCSANRAFLFNMPGVDSLEYYYGPLKVALHRAELDLPWKVGTTSDQLPQFQVEMLHMGVNLNVFASHLPSDSQPQDADGVAALMQNPETKMQYSPGIILRIPFLVKRPGVGLQKDEIVYRSFCKPLDLHTLFPSAQAPDSDTSGEKSS